MSHCYIFIEPVLSRRRVSFYKLCLLPTKNEHKRQTMKKPQEKTRNYIYTGSVTVKFVNTRDKHYETKEDKLCR